MGRGRVWAWAVPVLLLLRPSAGAVAQEASALPTAETVNLFFDCQGFGCWDLDFFRREIPYVNWVRDRQSADVHVLVTTQTTGGGGRQYVLAFLGRGRFEGQGQDLQVNTAGDATEDEVRRAIAVRLRLGLGRYLAGTAMADRLRVDVPGEGPGPAGPRPPGPPPGAPPQDDPWDFWSFRVGVNANLSGESSYSSTSLNTSVSANRTTDAWKLSFSGRLYEYEQTFDLGDGTESEYTREDRSGSGLVVRSVTDRFSLGMRGGVGKSTYLNEDFRWNLASGVELNAFPYAESSRRSLTLQGLLEARHWDYAEETIFGESAETRLAAQIRSELRLVQPWGNVSVSAEHSRYLHDTGKWMAGLGGGFEVRLFKGFSVNLYGNYEWIRDQLYISAAGATQEQILLRQRALSTDFEYYTSFGISYRFGSIFNNVVNPRFGGSSGGVMIMY
ncbi:MAG TPA: DUF481 domain-containing protein [Longimicrobiales bacterium]|nr:DUF481 domain-containing protein [Longimicrobiales bacterium]